MTNELKPYVAVEVNSVGMVCGVRAISFYIAQNSQEARSKAVKEGFYSGLTTVREIKIPGFKIRSENIVRETATGKLEELANAK